VPSIEGNAWAYVKQCLDTGWVSSAGSYVTTFEQGLSAATGSRHAVACVSGTAALHLALLAVGVEPEDEVIVPALTFVAPANAVRYAGAWPVFIDVEPEHWQLDTSQLTVFLERGCESVNGRLHNRATGRRVRAVLFVDLLGHPADAETISSITRPHGLALIEDATESLGASYHGEPLGRFADLTCLSFNGNKIITTGGGGAVLTDSDTLAGRCRHLSTQAKRDPLDYVHDEVGFNYRLTNLQAALGVAQLERLDAHVAAKRRIADRYAAAFDQVPGITPMREAPWAFSTFWLFTVLVDPDHYGCDSRALLRHLATERIQARPLWQPLHLSPAHAGAFCAGAPVAERTAVAALSLPSSVGLVEEDQRRVIDVIVARSRW
jgi:perosamine synthetase